MYSFLKTAHSYWALTVLFLLIFAIANAFIGIIKGKTFDSTDFRRSLFVLITSHIQILLGILLYFFSPWFGKWSVLGMGVMKDSSARLYLVEHPTVNLLAVVLITMGWSMHKRQSLDVKKFSRIGIFYSLGFFLILSRIPWNVWFQ
tara:strand:+ start:486 stop:923 length:438 start_codon:yes stop_codon:yes gene_type:complete